jgi:hypothetical protein
MDNKSRFSNLANCWSDSHRISQHIIPMLRIGTRGRGLIEPAPTSAPSRMDDMWSGNNQVVTQLRIIHNGVMMGIQWMVQWWVLVHFGLTGGIFTPNDSSSCSQTTLLLNIMIHAFPGLFHLFIHIGCIVFHSFAFCWPNKDDLDTYNRFLWKNWS